MEGLEYFEAWFGTSEIEEAVKKIRVESSLSEVFSNFQRNIARLNGTLMFPGIYVGIAARLQGCYSRASFEITKMAHIESSELSEDTHKQVVARMLELVRLSQEEDYQTELASFWEATSAMWKLIAVQYSSVEIIEAQRALRESLVIGAWTAIEVAYKELWDTANARSEQIGKLQGDKMRIIEASARKRGADIPPANKISAQTPPKLSSLQGARSTFSRGFSLNASAIDAAFSSPAFDGLAVVRNCLVHNRGRIDEGFKKGAIGITSLAPILCSATKELNIDQKLTATVILDSVRATIDLLVAADEWLQSNI